LSINATLLGQMITFAIFVWFTMRFVWPGLEQALEARENKIASGLAKAERAEKMLQNAKHDAEKIHNDAKRECSLLLEKARKDSDFIIEQAKKEAQDERDNIIRSGDAQVAQAFKQAKAKLLEDVTELVIAGVEKVLAREVKAADHIALIEQVISHKEASGG